MKALVIGATGATGKDLVNILLKDTAYTQVVVFVRKSTGTQHSRLTELITNFDKLEEVSSSIQGDVLFSCLGTTLKIAGSQEKQWHIDYEIPLQFATIAKRNGVASMVLLSAYGATTASRVFYSRMKGKLEEDIAALGFNQHVVFRPGLLLRKDTDRFAERVSGGLLNFFNSIGLFRKFKPLPTAVLAEKLAKAPKVLGGGKHIISLNEIFNF
ncbi:MAG: NAD(P)H-binding protein [Bacteroidota bacterium]